MNPLGLILLSLGLILIVIGFKGSQHNVINAFKGVKTAKNAAASSGTTKPIGVQVV